LIILVAVWFCVALCIRPTKAAAQFCWVYDVACSQYDDT